MLFLHQHLSSSKPEMIQSFHLSTCWRVKRRSRITLTSKTALTISVNYRYLLCNLKIKFVFKKLPNFDSHVLCSTVTVVSFNSTLSPICLHVLTHSLPLAACQWCVGGRQCSSVQAIRIFSKKTWHIPQMVLPLCQQVQSCHCTPHTSCVNLYIVSFR